MMEKAIVPQKSYQTPARAHGTQMLPFVKSTSPAGKRPFG
jgi:hypothetical protein